MKQTILLIIVALASTSIHAHTWEADRWADERIALVEDMRVCVEILNKDDGVNPAVCENIVTRAQDSIIDIAKAINVHADDFHGKDVDEWTHLIQFATAHFKNRARGLDAFFTHGVIKTGMTLIIRYKELRIEQQKQKKVKDLGTVV